MKNIIKIIGFALSIFLLVNCENIKSEKKQNFKIDNKKEIFNQNIYIKYDKIKNLTYDDFIDQFAVPGTPSKYFPYNREVFIIGDYDGMISEFRIELLKYHSEEEIKNNDILIKEVSWEASPNQNLTVWYERKNKQWIPIHHLIWDKGAEF